MFIRCDAIVIVALIAIGCGGSKGGSTPATPSSPTPPASSGGGGGTTSFDVNGSWTGTAGGARITFTVSNGGVTVFTLSQFPGCSTVYGFSATAPVSGNAFSYTIPSGNPDLSGTISGRFTSTSIASGDLNITFKTGCRGTFTSSWTASK